MDTLKKLRLLLPAMHIEKSKTLSVLQVIIAAIFVLGAALMCYVFVSNEWMSAADYVIAEGGNLSAVLAGGAEGPITSGNTGELQNIVSRLSSNRSLAYVRVTGAGGEILAQTGTTALAKELAAAEPAQTWEANDVSHAMHKLQGARYYSLSRPIHADAGMLGSVEVVFRHPPLLEYFGAGMRRGGVALLGVALLLMLGNYFLSVVIGPLSRLKCRVLAAQDCEPEKLDLEAKDGGMSGEAGEIAAGIDRIVSNIGSKYRVLADSNRELQVSNRVILFEKRRTEAIIDCLDEGVIVTDAYGRVSLINREAEALLQADRKEVLGRLPAEAFGKNKAATQFICAENTAGRRRCSELDFTSGTTRKIVRAVAAPLSGPSDKAAGTLTILRDVTQQKMEEQARRDFISSVAHELRAPLSAIKSYVEMLIDNEADTPELRAEFFNTINEEADRLARLIENLLNISRIEVGGLVLNKSSVKTRRLLEDALASVAGTAKGKNVKLTASLPDDLPDAELDKEMVRVALMNLLGNAIKYTDAGGSIVLAGEVDADEMRVHVIDTGWGIPADEQEKVFEKFYRGRRTAKDKVTGNGLGLALAKEIATLHGGDLRLLSEEGKGSKFTLCIPLK